MDGHSDTHSSPQYYYTSYYTSVFTSKEKTALKELFGRDLFSKTYNSKHDLKEDQIQRILTHIKPSMRRWLKTSDILPFLKKKSVLMEPEMQHLKTDALAPEEQSMRLVDYLMNKGTYGIAALYCCLVDSSEQQGGVPAHYQLAGELKEIVQTECGVSAVDDSEPLSSLANEVEEATQYGLQAAIQSLSGIPISTETATSFITNLGLRPYEHLVNSNSVRKIALFWLNSRTGCYVEELIEALVVTNSLGRYVSRFTTIQRVETSPGVRNFFLSLGGSWQVIALYLGYSQEELTVYTQKHTDNMENQVTEFLSVWQLPEIGQQTLPLMHKLKKLSGVAEDTERRPVERPDKASHEHRSRHLKTDFKGKPHRSLDSVRQRTSSRGSYSPHSSPTSSLSSGYASMGSYGNSRSSTREHDYQSPDYSYPNSQTSSRNSTGNFTSSSSPSHRSSRPNTREHPLQNHASSYNDNAEFRVPTGSLKTSQMNDLSVGDEESVTRRSTSPGAIRSPQEYQRNILKNTPSTTTSDSVTPSIVDPSVERVQVVTSVSRAESAPTSQGSSSPRSKKQFGVSLAPPNHSSSTEQTTESDVSSDFHQSATDLDSSQQRRSEDSRNGGLATVSTSSGVSADASLAGMNGRGQGLNDTRGRGQSSNVANSTSSTARATSTNSRVNSSSTTSTHSNMQMATSHDQMAMSHDQFSDERYSHDADDYYQGDGISVGPRLRVAVLFAGGSALELNVQQVSTHMSPEPLQSGDLRNQDPVIEEIFDDVEETPRQVPSSQPLLPTLNYDSSSRLAQHLEENGDQNEHLSSFSQQGSFAAEYKDEQSLQTKSLSASHGMTFKDLDEDLDFDNDLFGDTPPDLPSPIASGYYVPSVSPQRKETVNTSFEGESSYNGTAAASYKDTEHAFSAVDPSDLNLKSKDKTVETDFSAVDVSFESENKAASTSSVNKDSFGVNNFEDDLKEDEPFVVEMTSVPELKDTPVATVRPFVQLNDDSHTENTSNEATPTPPAIEVTLGGQSSTQDDQTPTHSPLFIEEHNSESESQTNNNPLNESFLTGEKSPTNSMGYVDPMSDTNEHNSLTETEHHSLLASTNKQSESEYVSSFLSGHSDNNLPSLVLSEDEQQDDEERNGLSKLDNDSFKLQTQNNGHYEESSSISSGEEDEGFPTVVINDGNANEPGPYGDEFIESNNSDVSLEQDLSPGDEIPIKATPKMSFGVDLSLTTDKADVPTSELTLVEVLDDETKERPLVFSDDVDDAMKEQPLTLSEDLDDEMKQRPLTLSEAQPNLPITNNSFTQGLITEKVDFDSRVIPPELSVTSEYGSKPVSSIHSGLLGEIETPPITQPPSMVSGEWSATFDQNEMTGADKNHTQDDRNPSPFEQNNQFTFEDDQNLSSLGSVPDTPKVLENHFLTADGELPISQSNECSMASVYTETVTMASSHSWNVLDGPDHPSLIGRSSPVSYNPTLIGRSSPVSYNPSLIGRSSPVSYNPSLIGRTSPVSYNPSLIGRSSPVSYNPTLNGRSSPRSNGPIVNEPPAVFVAEHPPSPVNAIPSTSDNLRVSMATGNPEAFQVHNETEDVPKFSYNSDTLNNFSDNSETDEPEQTMPSGQNEWLQPERPNIDETLSETAQPSETTFELYSERNSTGFSNLSVDVQPTGDVTLKQTLPESEYDDDEQVVLFGGETAASNYLAQPGFVKVTLEPDKVTLHGGDKDEEEVSLGERSDFLERDGVTRDRTEHEVHETCSKDVISAIEDPQGMEMLAALLASGGNLSAPTEAGVYPIHVATTTGNPDKVLLLLSKNANVNAQRKDGKTALHLACLRKDFQIVQILVEKGADPGLQDDQGYTCLHFKETLESPDIVSYLLHNGAPPDLPSKGTHFTPLLVCCFVGDTTLQSATALLNAGASADGVNLANSKPLVTACSEGSEQMVELLLENHADVNIADQDGNTPLMIACTNKHTTVAKRLCRQRGVDGQSAAVDINLPNKVGLTPLMEAVRTKNTDLVKDFLKRGVDVNSTRVITEDLGGDFGIRDVEVTALSEAAKTGVLEIAQMLIDYRAEVNSMSERMLPPVCFAIRGDFRDIVELLLKQNDIDRSTNGISGPFMAAVMSKNHHCAQLLLDRYYGGIDVLSEDARQRGMHDLVRHIHIYMQQIDAPPRRLAPPTHTPSPWQHEGMGRESNPSPDEPRRNEFDTSSSQNEPSNVQPSPSSSDNEGGRRNSPRPTPLNAYAQTQSVPSSSHPLTAFPTNPLTTYSTQGVTQSVPPQPSKPLNRFDDSEDEDTQSSVAGSVSSSTVSVSKIGFGKPLNEFNEPLPMSSASSGGQRSRDMHDRSDEDLPDGQSTGQTPPTLQFGRPLSGSPSFGRPLQHATADPERTPGGQTIATNLRMAFGHQQEPFQEFKPNPSPPTPGTLDSTSASSFGQPLGTQGQNDFGPAAISRQKDVHSRTPPPLPMAASYPIANDFSRHDSDLNEQTNNIEVASGSETFPPTDVAGTSVPWLQSTSGYGSNSGEDVVQSESLYSQTYSEDDPPLRARHNPDEEQLSLKEGDETDRSLFAPRPKTPPPEIPIPSISALSSEQMEGSGVETLHEFAQICISAACKSGGQEKLIEAATSSGHDHLANFFLQYFYNPAEFARSGKLVMEFIGGAPSPLNFLISNSLATKAGFNAILSEMGKQDFPDQLALALHQFPGSDHLPTSGEVMVSALFNQVFAIGSTGNANTRTQDTNSRLQELVRNMSNRSPSPPPPKPFSAPPQETTYEFPDEGGHRLGTDTQKDGTVPSVTNTTTSTVSPSTSDAGQRSPGHRPIQLTHKSRLLAEDKAKSSKTTSVTTATNPSKPSSQDVSPRHRDRVQRSPMERANYSDSESLPTVSDASKATAASSNGTTSSTHSSSDETSPTTARDNTNVVKASSVTRAPSSSPHSKSPTQPDVSPVRYPTPPEKTPSKTTPIKDHLSETKGLPNSSVSDKTKTDTDLQTDWMGSSTPALPTKNSKGLVSSSPSLLPLSEVPNTFDDHVTSHDDHMLSRDSHMSAFTPMYDGKSKEFRVQNETDGRKNIDGSLDGRKGFGIQLGKGGVVRNILPSSQTEKQVKQVSPPEEKLDKQVSTKDKEIDVDKVFAKDDKKTLKEVKKEFENKEDSEIVDEDWNDLDAVDDEVTNKASPVPPIWGNPKPNTFDTTPVKFHQSRPFGVPLSHPHFETPTQSVPHFDSPNSHTQSVHPLPPVTRTQPVSDSSFEASVSRSPSAVRYPPATINVNSNETAATNTQGSPVSTVHAAALPSEPLATTVTCQSTPLTSVLSTNLNSSAISGANTVCTASPMFTPTAATTITTSQSGPYTDTDTLILGTTSSPGFVPLSAVVSLSGPRTLISQTDPTIRTTSPLSVPLSAAVTTVTTWQPGPLISNSQTRSGALTVCTASTTFTTTVVSASTAAVPSHTQTLSTMATQGTVSSHTMPTVSSTRQYPLPVPDPAIQVVPSVESSTPLSAAEHVPIVTSTHVPSSHTKPSDNDNRHVDTGDNGNNENGNEPSSHSKSEQRTSQERRGEANETFHVSAGGSWNKIKKAADAAHSSPPSVQTSPNTRRRSNIPVPKSRSKMTLTPGSSRTNSMESLTSQSGSSIGHSKSGQNSKEPTAPTSQKFKPNPSFAKTSPLVRKTSPHRESSRTATAKSSGKKHSPSQSHKHHTAITAQTFPKEKTTKKPVRKSESHIKEQKHGVAAKPPVANSGIVHRPISTDKHTSDQQTHGKSNLHHKHTSASTPHSSVTLQSAKEKLKRHPQTTTSPPTSKRPSRISTFTSDEETDPEDRLPLPAPKLKREALSIGTLIAGGRTIERDTVRRKPAMAVQTSTLSLPPPPVSDASIPVAIETSSSLKQSFPNYPIPVEEIDNLFSAIASRITKWTFLGRYLNIDDDTLERIAASCRFDVERCYQMLRRWSRISKEGATYLKLAQGLKNIMREDLLHDLVVRPQTTSVRSTSAEAEKLTDDKEGFDLDFDIPVSDERIETFKDKLDKFKNNKIGQHAHVTCTMQSTQSHSVSVSIKHVNFVLPSSLDDVSVIKTVCEAAEHKCFKKVVVFVKFICM